jgi:choline-sulfatase
MSRSHSLPRHAALLLLPLLAVACGGDDAPPSGPRLGTYDGSGRLIEGERSRVSPPNLVLIVLDTTRADAIEPVDGGPPDMPALRAFADRSTRFLDASSSASWTAPSVTSILTGLLPSEHGVAGRFQASPLVPAVATLAEYLKSAGYQTAGFTGGGWVSAEMGLAQGFDRFDEPWSIQDPQDTAMRWLRQADPGRPIFLLLHTYDAHDPYGPKMPPEGHDDPARLAEAQDLVRRIVARVGDGEISFGDALDAPLRREVFLAWRGDPLVRQTLQTRFGRERPAESVIRYVVEDLPQAPDRDRVLGQLRARYRHGLSTMDAHLGRFLEKLDASGLPGRTVVAVCSDHGEGFGEGGVVGHGRWLREVLTHVLFMVRAPGRLEAGPVHGSCGVIDVVPTLLDLAGLPAPRGIAGQSVVPLALGRSPGHPVRAEEYRTLFGSNPRLDRTTARSVSVRTERGKWIGTWDPRSNTTREEVYDLGADPGEEHPLPAGEVARFGPEFAAEVDRAKALIATFPGRSDNDGTGRFTGGE